MKRILMAAALVGAIGGTASALPPSELDPRNDSASNIFHFNSKVTSSVHPPYSRYLNNIAPANLKQTKINPNKFRLNKPPYVATPVPKPRPIGPGPMRRR